MDEEPTVEDLYRSAVRAGMTNSAMYHVAHLARIARDNEKRLANLEERLSVLERAIEDDGK